MLFTLRDAIKVRNHYYNILRGTPISAVNRELITGLLICRPTEVAAHIEKMLQIGEENTVSFLTTEDDAAKEFRIYVLADNGSDILYKELDRSLTEKGIEKVY